MKRELLELVVLCGMCVIVIVLAAMIGLPIGGLLDL
jgi:hypothetical protein